MEGERGTNICQVLGLCYSQSAVLPYAGDLIYGNELWTAVAVSCDFCDSCRAVTAASSGRAVIGSSATTSDCSSWARKNLSHPAGPLCCMHTQASGKKGCVPVLVLGSFECDSVILASGVQAYFGAIVRGKEETGIILREKNKLHAAIDCREKPQGLWSQVF